MKWWNSLEWYDRKFIKNTLIFTISSMLLLSILVNWCNAVDNKDAEIRCAALKQNGIDAFIIEGVWGHKTCEIKDLLIKRNQQCEK